MLGGRSRRRRDPRDRAAGVFRVAHVLVGPLRRAQRGERTGSHFAGTCAGSPNRRLTAATAMQQIIPANPRPQPRHRAGDMSYAVKEIFLTLQGEGAQAGRVAVFCRFAGCNLWSGREADRAEAQCSFCDTDFVGTDGTRGGRYEAAVDLAEAIESEWGATRDFRAVVLTGGEPLLQADDALLDALHARGFWIAVETN